MKITKKHVMELYFAFMRVWGDKFTKHHTEKNIVSLWIDDWFEGLNNVNVEIVNKTFSHCKVNMIWPPSLAEFIQLCEKYSGTPDYAEAFECALKRDFKHPAIKKAFDAIGSWDFQHQEDKILRQRFKDAYVKFLEESRTNKLLALTSEEKKYVGTNTENT